MFQKMLVNLSKLLFLIQAIQVCPNGVPKRDEKLYNDYSSFKSTSDHIVSIQVSIALERLVETNLDSEDEKRRKLIVKDIIRTYSENSFRFPSNQAKIYLVSPLTTCNVCDNGTLVLVKPSRCGKGAVVYTLDGGKECELFHKYCTNCHSTIYSCYSEYRVGGILHRKYLQSTDVRYFGVTTETFFETTLFRSITEDIFTCHSRITNIVEKYNNLTPGKIQLNKKRLFPAWIIFSINEKFRCEFPVLRDLHHNLDVDAVCEYLYPQLKSCVDDKWKEHECDGCRTKIVVMDGAAKLYRTVCAARGDKISNVGELNQFTACSNSPVNGLQFCKIHMDDKSGDVKERLDIGVMTRQRRRELGLDVEELTSTEGCRREENITVRSQRSKTAGMLYCFRACGVTMGHVEMIHAETCTAFVCLLIELFGTNPGSDTLTGVAIDRGNTESKKTILKEIIGLSVA